MRLLLLYLYLLLLIPPFSNAALSCITDATSIILSEQGTLISGVIIFTVIIIAIAYLLGSFTGNPAFTVFAKDEAYHLGFSIALLISFSVIILFSCSAVDMFFKTTFEKIGAGSSPCYESGENMTATALCFLDGAKSDAQRLSERYIDENIHYMMWSTYTVSLNIPLMNTFSASAGAYKRVIASQYDTTLNMFVFPALLSLRMQELFLGFVSENVIRWLLPIAFLFRIFIPTRQMGNMLIALSIGLYLIVPFMYAFNLSAYEIIGSEECNQFRTAIEDNHFGGCGDQNSFWAVARLIPQAFFLPNLTIAILIAFLTGANKALRVIG